MSEAHPQHQPHRPPQAPQRAHPVQGQPSSIRSAPVAMPAAKAVEEEPLELEPEPDGPGDGLEPLSLVEGEADAAAADAPVVSKIRAFGAGNTQRAAQQWKRHPKVSGTGAIRVRSFHGRLSEQGLDFMDNQINEWLDGHPEIEIKQVTTTIGQFEGKIREPALVVNIWY